jgi:hypothetical protein
VNANPSGSRTPTAGGRGRSQTRREIASTTEPSPGLIPVVGCAGFAGTDLGQLHGPTGGTRHAMTVCRGARRARRAVQGRFGNPCSRYIVRHLVRQPLLSANTSVPADAVRPLRSRGARLWPPAESTVQLPSSRSQAQPTDRFSPLRGVYSAELVQPARGVTATPAGGQSRGKGVLAA